MTYSTTRFGVYETLKVKLSDGESSMIYKLQF